MGMIDPQRAFINRQRSPAQRFGRRKVAIVL
jgi:hypothetical protein